MGNHIPPLKGLTQGPSTSLIQTFQRLENPKGFPLPARKFHISLRLCHRERKSHACVQKFRPIPHAKRKPNRIGIPSGAHLLRLQPSHRQIRVMNRFLHINPYTPTAMADVISA